MAPRVASHRRAPAPAPTPGETFCERLRINIHANERGTAECREYNLYAPFLCKSIAYRHESEIRAVFADIPGGMQKTARPGYFVPVDLARLVETVTVSPLAPSWFADLVRDTCTQFGFGFTVTSSIVTVVPIY
jgi:hypothetical protein